MEENKMASLRTRTYYFHAVHIFFVIAVFLYQPTDTLTATPSLDPRNSSIIIWGDLPPIPTANGDNSSSSRPGLLAQMAQGFVDLVQPQGLPYSYIRFAINETVRYNTNYFSENLNAEVWKILSLFVGIVICILIGVVYFIVVPLTGLIFSCCRCCDRCGGKRVQRESKHIGCMRVMLSLIFFAITGIICAGMAFTNVSNEFIAATFVEIKSTADSSLTDLETYFTKADEQIDYMVTKEYGFVDNLLTDNLQDIGAEIGEPIQSYVLNEAGLQDLLDAVHNISMTFAEIEVTLTESDNLRSILISESAVLQEELDDVVANLNEINAACSNCAGDVSGLTVTVNFTKLPPLETQIQGVAEANIVVMNIANETMSILKNLPEQITNMTSDAVDQTLTQLNNAESQVNDSFKEVSDKLIQLAGEISNAKTSFDDAWPIVEEEYSKYVYYGLIGLTCTVLLIIMFNLIGLTMGTFSYKTVHPTERSRMSNAGGNVLMAGVFFTFFFAPILILITCVLFGVFSFTTLTCDPLVTYELFEKTIDQPGVITDGYYLGELLLNDSSIPLNMSGILTQCESDESAYSALMLESLYNFTAIKEQLDTLTDELHKIIDEINISGLNLDFPFADFTDDITSLVNTTELGSINYTEYSTVLASDITGTNLTMVASHLKALAGNSSNQNVAANLTAEADALLNIQAQIVVPMQMNMKQILTNLDLIDDLEGQLDQQINRTIDLITISETNIESNETSDAIYSISVAYVDRLIGYGDQFYVKIEQQITQDFARCQLLSDVYAYLVDTACDYVIDSGNTLWFTVGWCVFFYVPSIIFSVKLAKYYRIMDEDAPYRAPKSKKKKKKQTRRSSDEEMPMDDMRDDGATGPDNVRLVENNGRPHSMTAQQNPHYIPDEPILAYNDLGRPMAPPPAYNPAYPKGFPPGLPPMENPVHYQPQGARGSYYDRPYGGPSYGPHSKLPTSGSQYDEIPFTVTMNETQPFSSGGSRQSTNMYEYNQTYNQAF